MTGIDTNILVRYFVKDDPHQTRLAVTFLRGRTPSDPGWVSLTALAELAWVLAYSYKRKRTEILQVIEMLLLSEDIVVESERIAMQALTIFRNGKADFPDCLICMLAKGAGCDRVFTFDRMSARDAGMELLS
jgi:predicted nucleic-acid-binding protein